MGSQLFRMSSCPQDWWHSKYLLTGHKNRLLAIMLFGQYCEDEDKPIVNWKQVTRDEFNHFRSYSLDHFSEKLTVDPSFKVDSTCIWTTVPTESMQDATDLESSTSAKDAEGNAVTSRTTCIHKQPMSKYHGHCVVPVKQQEIGMISSLESTKSHLVFHLEAKSVILHLEWTMFLGLWRSLLFCLGP